MKTKLSAMALAVFISGGAWAQEQIIVQSTTSTANSGLYDYLLPIFQEKTGIQVNVVAVGTGQAIKNAQNCDGDVLLVHAKASENKFVEAGYGTQRTDLMYNDFVILGPQQDPAGIATAKTVGEAMQAIRAHGANFASRGDNSGTNRAERRLWKAGGHIPDAGDSGWYLETGMGMGATLNFAVQAKAYTISDRATWLAFGNKAGHEILFEGDPNLFNQYGVIPVSPARCPMIKHQAALDFRDWLVSADGQSAIAAFQKHGSQLFFPNAAVAGSALASRQGTVSSPPPGMTASVN